MGEIKSTLDLVMERTRHLSLSAEERAQQKQEEFGGRLQGLLQQYDDGALAADTLHARIAALQNALQLTVPQAVRDAVIQRIDPDRDNARWLDLLPAQLQTALQPILANHAETLRALVQASRERQLTELARAHAVAGSAVVPNPQKDPRYRQAQEHLRRKTQSELAARAA